MRKITLEQFHAELKAQGVPHLHLAMKCPMCGTIQSAADLIATGTAGHSFEEVEKYLGFSCVGRFTHRQPPPKEKGTQVGCDWTLGGLFSLHELTVMTPDGQTHPRFELATPKEAQDHICRKLFPVRPAIQTATCGSQTTESSFGFTAMDAAQRDRPVTQQRKRPRHGTTSKSSHEKNHQVSGQRRLGLKPNRPKNETTD